MFIYFVETFKAMLSNFEQTYTYTDDIYAVYVCESIFRALLPVPLCGDGEGDMDDI